MNLYLIRHGQDDEQVKGGWANNELLKEGKSQGHLLGKRLKTIRFDKLYSSDLNRAKETAEIIHSYQKYKRQIHFSSELRGINNGILAGMNRNIAEKKYPGMHYRMLEFDEKYPGGESPKEFYERIHYFFEKKIRYSMNKNVLIVTHGAVINVMYHILNKIPYTNKSTELTFEIGSFTKISL